jgi:phenylacetate-CoA ligase
MAPFHPDPRLATLALPRVESTTRARVAAAAARARSAPAYADFPAELDDLLLVPVTKKAAVHADPTRYFTSEVADACFRFETSGTSATPLPIYRTQVEQASNVAAVRAALPSTLFSGERLRVVSLLNHNRKAVGALIEALFADHLLFRGFFFEPSGPQPEATGVVMRELGATVIVGTPGVVNELELGLRAQGTFAATAGTVKRVLLLGEPVTPAGRERIARAWGAEALELSYGSSETTTIAVGCADGHLHVLEDRFELEVRSGEEISPAAPGSTGELIATPLHLRALALLRYATGDRVTFGPAGECACGSHAMTLRIWGREDDLVVLPDGRRVGPAEIEHAAYELAGAMDYQVLVDRTGVVTALRLQPFPGSAVRRAPVRRELGVPTEVVDHVPGHARAGSVVKSWRRTRVVLDRGRAR